MKKKRLTTVGMIIIIALFTAHLYADEETDAAIHAAKEKALIWLKKQKVPNSVFPNPQPDRRNLVISYEIPKDAPDYRYLAGRSIIYDDALAAIAFTMNKDYRDASQILLALKRLQRSDGGLWFGYNVNNDWPSEKDSDGAVDRTGASAWAGYAAVYFLQSRMSGDHSFIQTNREAKMILEFAKSLGSCIRKMQILDKSDIRYGLITGGKNSFTLKLEKNTVNEIFRKSTITWISTEHNIDAYFFLRDLGEITGDESFTKSSSLIKDSLMRAWSEKDKQYYRGIKTEAIDTELALDCASWGAVFSLSSGRTELADQSLITIEKLYSSSYTSSPGSHPVYGYKPYTSKDIYEETDSNIIQYYIPSPEKRTWKSINGVWVEGSLGAALAYLKTGNRNKTAEILKNVLPLQEKSGGFTYFTHEIPHEFSTHISVASTAWYIMVASSLEDPSVAAGFWKKEIP